MHGQFHYLYRGLGDAGLVVAMAEARGTEGAGRSDVGGSTSGWRSVGECGGVCRRNYTIKWCPDGRQLGAPGYGPFSSCHSESICIVMAPCFPFLLHPPARHPLTYKYRYGSFSAEEVLAMVPSYCRIYQSFS